MSRKSPPQSPHDPFDSGDDEPTYIGPPGGEEEPIPEGFPFENLEDGPVDDDELTVPGVPLDYDSFEDSNIRHRQVVLDPDNTSGTGRFRSVAQSAREASQGPWRERALSPRGLVQPEHVVLGLDEAVTVAGMQSLPLAKARTALRAELLPLLRQAVEWAGGDGLDAWLSRLLSPPGARARDGLWEKVAGHVQRLSAAPQREALLAEAKGLLAVTRRALLTGAPNRLSLAVLEAELEGKVEVDALLSIAVSTEAELADRADQVERTLDSMRVQMRGLPGASPNGLMWNFSRLKVEKRIVEAELARRKGPARRAE